MLTLPDLFPATVTIPVIDSLPDPLINELCGLLPPTILLLAQETDADPSDSTATPAAAQAAIEALTTGQKKDILRRVLRSPQLTQSMASLTVALRDGGLPTVSEALELHVDNRGYIRGGSMPLGGAQAVEAFLEGLKRAAEEEEQ
jgi:26S proteasome regulatory subunit N13